MITLKGQTTMIIRFEQQIPNGIVTFEKISDFNSQESFA